MKETEQVSCDSTGSFVSDCASTLPNWLSNSDNMKKSIELLKKREVLLGKLDECNKEIERISCVKVEDVLDSYKSATNQFAKPKSKCSAMMP